MANRFGNISIFSHDLKIDFMRLSKVCMMLSVLLVIASLAFVGIRGLNYSIDFLGGTEINFSSKDSNLDAEKIKAIIAATGRTNFEVNEFQDPVENKKSFVARFQRQPGQNEETTSKETEGVVAALKESIGEANFRLDSITNIAGKVGKEEERKGYLSLLLAFGGILLYVWYRFDLRFAPGAVACLVHDVIIALGIMTLLGRPFNVGSIAAFLTVIGYSMNDTVIVYDRIRETMANNPRLSSYDAINLSINQTMNRTVLTSSTALGALIVLAYFGGGSIEDFALTMLIGIFVGTYSSIYVAAPSALVLDEFLKKRGINLGEKSKEKTKRDADYCPPVVLKRKPTPEAHSSGRKA